MELRGAGARRLRAHVCVCVFVLLCSDRSEERLAKRR